MIILPIINTGFANYPKELADRVQFEEPLTILFHNKQIAIFINRHTRMIEMLCIGQVWVKLDADKRTHELAAAIQLIDITFIGSGAVDIPVAVYGYI